ncbi:hypothetical protein FVA81_06410 [Rhizobium sp. WL3]|uniref:hypothetical protein n=1 Tax=Rhizobium sp. WL3 TaxID=2603277 RepID=UPI0011C2038C|nr:hypothetical protein [Rhizobium sp. WL3]QEE44272.1 hypothetical protein FVA81_06410 [Rhizobium sp. WL3]
MLDVDDRLRALQIRLLASGQVGWFDLSIPAVRLPEVYVSPWSRLVDLPYVSISWMLAPFVGDSLALRIAFSVWPLAMLVAFAMLVAVFLQRSMRETGWKPLRTALVVCLVALVMAPAFRDFSPGRIDHHNWQLIAMVCLMTGLQRYDRMGGLIIGLSSAVSLLVGLECLPFVVVAYGALVLSWLAKMPRAEVVMGSAGGSIAAASVLLGIIFVGPVGLATAACDSFSAPFALAALGFGLALVALGWWGAVHSVFRRMLLLAIAGVVVLTVVVPLYPECLGGPYAMIEPVVRASWLDRIPQEHGLVFQVWNGSTSLLPLFLVLSLIAVWALAATWKRRHEEPGQVLAFAIGVVALVAAVVQLRYARFSVSLMPLFLPVVLVALLSGRLRPAWPILSASSALIVVGIVFAAVGLNRNPARFELIDTMADPCEHADFSALETLAPGRVLAPHGLGLPLLEAGKGQLEVAAIPFHRAAPGLSTVFAAFLSGDPAVRRLAVQNFDYVAICALPAGHALPGGEMYAALINGNGWPGLVEWSPDSLSPLRIFRIDHAHFR